MFWVASCRISRLSPTCCRREALAQGRRKSLLPALHGGAGLKLSQAPFHAVMDGLRDLVFELLAGCRDVECVRLLGLDRVGQIEQICELPVGGDVDLDVALGSGSR